MGFGPSQIVRILAERRIKNPKAHEKSRGINISDNREYTDDDTWGTSTITHMLARQEYLGRTVNFKTHHKSYKQKKLLKNDPSQWAVFENTHEAIIDQETFDIVQWIHDGRRRLTPMGEAPLLSGMLFCADCGKELYLARTRNNSQAPYYVCSTYRKRKGMCTSHQIRSAVVEKLLLEGIREITGLAREREDESVRLVMKKSRAESDRNLRENCRELE